MQQKIFEKLKQAYSQLGLGDDFLQAHATSLAALGLVTDENIDTVISVQKEFLERAQKENDRRVTEGVKNATKKLEDDFKKKEEDLKKTSADELEKLKKEAEEARLKAEELEKSNASDKEKAEAAAKAKAAEDAARAKAQEEAEKAQNEARAQMQAELKALKDELGAMKKEAATHARKAMIDAKIKELEIPQWRVDEGFNISDEATEQEVSEYLSKVANNIKVQTLPARQQGLPLGDDKPSKEEIAEIAKQIVN